MEVLAKTSNADYEIHQIGCNVCKPPKDEGLIDNKSYNIPTYLESKPKSSGKNIMLWVIIILFILLFVGLLFMRRPQKKLRR